MATTTPLSGTISFGDIRTVFQGEGEVKLSNFYSLIEKNTNRKLSISEMYNQRTPNTLITFTKTPLAIGRYGPTLSNILNNYGGLVSLWNNIDGYQLYTIPTGGAYIFEVHGALGGHIYDKPVVNDDTSVLTQGGLGGKVTSRFYIPPNSQIIVTVGQKPAFQYELEPNLGFYAHKYGHDTVGPGGGATTVCVVPNGSVVNPFRPILVAGGGGGASRINGVSYVGKNANQLQTGDSDPDPRPVQGSGGGFSNDANVFSGIGGGWITTRRSVGGLNADTQGGFGGGSMPLGPNVGSGGGGYSGGDGSSTGGWGGTNWVDTNSLNAVAEYLSHSFSSTEFSGFSNGRVFITKCV